MSESRHYGNNDRLPAVFMRGGTSKAVIFHRKDLPFDRRHWDGIFLSVIGSPDPYGRQLDGMGGGVSSLSKVCVVGPPSVAGADVDYTFAQVLVREAKVDYSGNCGNMSSAIGPFSVDEGLLSRADGSTTVCIHNTNTGKLIRATFEVERGRAKVAGDLAIPGVTGTAAPVRLDFQDPGGASTGLLLPTNRTTDMLDIPGTGPVTVSMVDAANACVFFAAEDVGLAGIEMPDELEGNQVFLEVAEKIRRLASVAMGIADTPEAAASTTMIPFVGLVSPAQNARTSSGEMIDARDIDVTLRMLSNGQPHRALPLTGSLCAAVAARTPGTVVHRFVGCPSGNASEQPTAGHGPLRIGMPAGIMMVEAEVCRAAGTWTARRGSFYRTARRLFDGHVYPAQRSRDQARQNIGQ